MDPLIYVAISVLSLIIIISIFLLKKYSNQEGDGALHVEDQGVVQQAPPAHRAVEARAGGRRVVRRRLGNRRQQQEDSDEEQEELFDDIAQPEGKIGAKKLAKLQAKEEKRRHAEAEKEEREERKRRDALQETQRKKDEEKDAAEEAAKEEELKRIKEEEEKREYEEYLKLKEAFTVDEEGTHEAEIDQDTESLLQNFIDYIKSTKVVMLEDLAAHFQLKTQSCIDRVQDLQEEGRLPGVMDDRGKFIYITQKEYESVAKFIQQRGRVSISELAESSNKLITLTPEKPVVSDAPVTPE